SLGLIVTATHTAGVYLLGIVTLALSQYIVPERLYPWLGVLAGALMTGLGCGLFFRRYAGAPEGHPHGHRHAPRHAHPPPPPPPRAPPPRSPRDPCDPASPPHGGGAHLPPGVAGPGDHRWDCSLPGGARGPPQCHCPPPGRIRAPLDRGVQRGARSCPHHAGAPDGVGPARPCALSWGMNA